MPTEPFEPLLNRDISKVSMRPLIDIASPLLQETVNYATSFYRRCQTSNKGGSEEAYPVLASYLHIIQMTDSVEVLISNGCGAPANLLLRSAFEGRLTIGYILERKSGIRANCWIVKNILDQIDDTETIAASNIKGKEFRKAWEKEGLGNILKPPSIPDLPERIAKLRGSLERPEYKEIYSEYMRARREKNRFPEWYSLYEGPHNLRQLAQYLGQGILYQSLYVSSSRMSHFSDASHLTLPLEAGTSVLGPIRNPMHVVHIAGNAFLICFDSTLLMLKEYRTGEMNSFLSWYRKELKEKHETIVNMQFGELDWFERTFVKGKQKSP